MINIISPENFTTSLWKNGKGKTTELAISDNSSIAKFIYRLSIADVSEDGMFSNFCGLTRKLILLEGEGITLTHNDTTIDSLMKPLNYACFDGGYQTYGQLKNGPIVDFNLMYDPKVYRNKLQTYLSPINEVVPKAQLCFIFSANKPLTLTKTSDKTTQTIPANHLLKLTDVIENQYRLQAEQVIIIQLDKRK